MRQLILILLLVLSGTLYSQDATFQKRNFSSNLEYKINEKYETVITEDLLYKYLEHIDTCYTTTTSWVLGLPIKEKKEPTLKDFIIWLKERK